MKKEEIRRQIRARKALLEYSEKVEAAERVFSKLRELAAYTVAKRVLLYHSLDDELSTRDFLESMSGDKEFFLPRVNGVNLEILPYDRSRLHLGAFRIEEPDGEDVVSIDDIDLVVVPAVAYDRKGNRVGRGKGFYDRLLSSSGKGRRVPTVGVCYWFQLVDEIDAEPFDVAVDFVITDRDGIIRTSRFR